MTPGIDVRQGVLVPVIVFPLFRQDHLKDDQPEPPLFCSIGCGHRRANKYCFSPIFMNVYLANCSHHSGFPFKYFRSTRKGIPGSGRIIHSVDRNGCLYPGCFLPRTNQTGSSPLPLTLITPRDSQMKSSLIKL